MKHLSRAFIAVILAALMAMLLPVQVFADSQKEYISEVKVYIGNYKDAKTEGFKILNDDNGNPVDLNKGAGGGWGSQGDKAVYFGYKTTTDKDEAVTDLALMNMKGAYSVKDYEYLMDTQMKRQIIPFVDNFLSSIKEYRENYKSKNKENKVRAQFIHNVLNKFTDDDCGGAGLGDLLLNETVYEIAKPMYDALSKEEKKKTSLYEINLQVKKSLPTDEKNSNADILTIVAQSNGKLMLMIQNLLTRAADSNKNTWLDRFENTTYDDLLVSTGLGPKDATKALAKRYDDDANMILSMWDTFRDELVNYDKNVETVENYDVEEAKSVNEAMADIDDNTSDEEAAESLIDYANLQITNLDFINSAQSAVIHDVLADIDYLDGTLLDFFSMTSEEIEGNITLLYPLVASLTNGQKASLDFVTLKDLFAAALTTADGYKSIDLSKIEKTSIYADVDRAIYESGGVALTSDALRTDAMAKAAEQDNSMFNPSTIALMVITGVTAMGALLSFSTYATIKLDVYSLRKGISMLGEDSGYTAEQAATMLKGHKGVLKALRNAKKDSGTFIESMNKFGDKYAERMAPKSALYGKLAIGFTVAMVLIAAVTTYLSWRDMKEYYKVDFSPAPRYIIDEKDLIGYNVKGEKIVLKNQSAYYKAVESNLKKGDFKFDEIGSIADMNGGVGKQWLVLYAVKNEATEPILLSSLKVVVDDSDVPPGYTTGIHMFGSDAAFNLNSSLYDWNKSAKSVFVYYKTDSSSTSITGSNFTAGMFAIAGGGGLLLGAAGTYLAMTVSKKRKENKTVTA